MRLSLESGRDPVSNNWCKVIRRIVAFSQAFSLLVLPIKPKFDLIFKMALPYDLLIILDYD